MERGQWMALLVSLGYSLLCHQLWPFHQAVPARKHLVCSNFDLLGPAPRESSCTYCVCHHTVWQPLGFTFLVFSLVARDACATCLDQLTHQPSHLPAISTMNCRAVCCHFCPGLLLFNWQWLMAMRQGRAEQKRSKKVRTEFWTTQNGTSSHRWHFFLPVTQKHFFASCHSTLEGD